MGACQNQFHNVPDNEINQDQIMMDISQPEYEQRLSYNTIKRDHRNVKPNSKQIKFGMINNDTRIMSHGSVSDGGSSNLGSISNGEDAIKQLDREELHMTKRPFQDNQKIIIEKQEDEPAVIQEKEKEELDLAFYRSLALPEFAYQPIPEQYQREYENLQVGEQEERNGVKYIGEWKDNYIHGNGVMQSNTTKYIGQFRNGMKCFYGREIEKEEVYEGRFWDGRRKGKGVRYCPQFVEEGQFNEDLIDGVITYANGDIYTGSLKNRKYHGAGELRQASKSMTYKGNFKNGKLSGEGEILFDDGKNYVGNFEDGMKSGKGRFYWDEKNIYDGEYYKGKKHGRGTLIRNGTVYEGGFKNGTMHGKMLVYDIYDKDKKQAKMEQYVNGSKVQEYDESLISQGDGLPEQWRAVVSS